MVDVPEPPTEAADNPFEQPSDYGDPDFTPRRRSLGVRTLALCVLVAMMAAILAGFIASILLSRDSKQANAEMTLTAIDEIDTDALVGRRLLTVDGKATTLYQQMGKQRTLVNFWQSTCTPCIKEMPLLEQAQAANPDVAFVGVATQDRLEAAKKRATQTKITYTWVPGPDGTLFYEANAAGLPTTLLLDSDGQVLALETGAFNSAKELQSFLDDNPGS